MPARHADADRADAAVCRALGQHGSIPARLHLLEEHDRAVTAQIAELQLWQDHLQRKIANYPAELATLAAG